VNALSNLWQKLNRSERYRESFPSAVVKRMLPLQIRVLRKQRGWSQAQLAQESKLTQGVISRAEDPDYGNLTVNTLVRIAAGFDCAFIGRFVPFSELGKWYTTLSNEKALEVPSFKDDSGFIERKAPKAESKRQGNEVLMFYPNSAGTYRPSLSPVEVGRVGVPFKLEASRDNVIELGPVAPQDRALYY
jgi:transcriptional regulator with XRE-family HTH domain